MLSPDLNATIIPYLVFAGVAVSVWYAFLAYKEVRQLGNKDHSETHRLAEIFRAEKIDKRNYCMKSLKQRYNSETQAS